MWNSPVYRSSAASACAKGRKLVELVDPRGGSRLERSTEGGGKLKSAVREYPLVNGIPRICDPENYTGSFGFQWNKFVKTQLDRQHDESQHNEQRLFSETNWDPEDLDGLDILEVGSGAGRFSRVILKHTNARLWSVDYSSAVDANWANNGAIAPDRFHLFQASIYEMPFPDDSFDKVLCLGVLQHTPDFEASVRALIRKAKPGAEIVVDFYPTKGFWSKLNAKYLLRPITRRMDQKRLLGLIERNVDGLISAHRRLQRMGLGVLNRFLPLCGIGAFPPGLSEEEVREIAVLDTFDMFSPAYDNPQSVKKVAAMFRRNGAEVTFAGFVEHSTGTAAVVRGIKEAAEARPAIEG